MTSIPESRDVDAAEALRLVEKNAVHILDVRTLWKRRHPLGTIEKIVFTSEPYSDVMAYVCLPATVAPPYSFFVCLQGHSTGAHKSIAVDRDDNSVPIDVEGDRDFGLGCMERGVAALCIEQRSFGERREQHQERVATHGCHDATMHALMLGRTHVVAATVVPTLLGTCASM